MTDTTDRSVAPRRILVSGDLVVDHFLYTGERMTPTARTDRGLRHVSEVGGAEGIRRLLTELNQTAARRYAKEAARRAQLAREAADAGVASGEAEAKAAEAALDSLPKLVRPAACEVSLCVSTPDPHGPHASHHAAAVWKTYPIDRKQPNGPKVWRVSAKMGYGQTSSTDSDCGFTPQPIAIDGHRDVLVLDDAGFIFRNHEHKRCWHLETPVAESPWILLKLAAPIAQGDLWRALVPADKRDAGYTDHLVCLVSAHDLRREAVRVTPSMSWEKTLEDLSEELNRPALAPLARCRHLVVVFGGDAVLWIDRENPDRAARFCFAPDDAEGDFAARIDGEAVGYLTTMAAALGYGIAQTGPHHPLDLAPWMAAGLRGMRDLLLHGHGGVGTTAEQQPKGYPVQRLAATILPPGLGDLAEATIAWPRPTPDDRKQPRKQRPWMIVESTQRPLGARELPTLVGLAGEVVRCGQAAYRSLPHAKFGKFVTAERSEIELLRGIRALMHDYQRHARTGAKPLSIGVFGPPGAGKSFAVRQIAEEIFSKDAWLEFNLSQFTGSVDLNGALHQVRDKVLDGVTPVVFWDEFELPGIPVAAIAARPNAGRPVPGRAAELTPSGVACSCSPAAPAGGSRISAGPASAPTRRSMRRRCVCSRCRTSRAGWTPITMSAARTRTGCSTRKTDR